MVNHPHIYLYPPAVTKSFQRTTFRYITVLPSGLSTGGIAPWALPNPSWITAVSSCIHQLGVVRQHEGMTVRGLRPPVLTVQTTFSSSLKTIVVPAIASDTPVDLFSFCVGWRERTHGIQKSRQVHQFSGSKGPQNKSLGNYKRCSYSPKIYF